LFERILPHHPDSGKQYFGRPEEASMLSGFGLTTLESLIRVMPIKPNSLILEAY